MRYILGVFGMIILGAIAVMLFARTTTNRGGDVQTGVKTVKTTDYVNDKSVVEFVQYGEVTANEERRTLKIRVSETERVIQILDGYQEMVQKSQSYSNNRAAYESFMKALDFAGFTRKKVVDAGVNEDSCPTGIKYIYKLNNDSQEVSNLWNNSCAPLNGTLGNNGSLIRSLFQKQIPDYSDVVQGVSF